MVWSSLLIRLYYVKVSGEVVTTCVKGAGAIPEMEQLRDGLKQKSHPTKLSKPVAGMPDEPSLVKSYAHQRDLKLPLIGLSYFQALSCYRLASIIQGVYARSVWGNASNEESAKHVWSMVKPLAVAGLSFTRFM
ncbi:acyl-CoA dehydrogenase family member 11-like isoform X2 [Dysidea avara]|uniref:acyl-CoA dehydrogenase family member 11-like isoform X2 n=1 Tax=Dysidea avara TaxID=196820 RepID=UPI00331C57DA